MKLRSVYPPLLLGMTLLTTVLNGWAYAAETEGDAAAGARKAIFCAYCHGSDGNPPFADQVPRLAGQTAKNLVIKMKYQVPSQNQHHEMMQAFQTGGLLNDRDIENLAAYFASQPIRTDAQAVAVRPTGE